MNKDTAQVSCSPNKKLFGGLSIMKKENIKKGSLQSNKLKTINSFYYNRLPYHVQQMKELFNSSSL